MTITDADRAAAFEIDALEWLTCDGRINPAFIVILAAHRIAGVLAGRESMREEAVAVAWEYRDSRDCDMIPAAIRAIPLVKP